MWEMRGDGVRYCGPALSGAQGRQKDGTYGDLIGLAGRGLARHFRLGTCSNRDTRSARHVVGEGALRGRSPRTREGRIGPTAQRRGEKREKHHFICRQLESELAVGWLLSEVRESLPSFWDARLRRLCLQKSRNCGMMDTLSHNMSNADWRNHEHKGRSVGAQVGTGRS